MSTRAVLSGKLVVFAGALSLHGVASAADVTATGVTVTIGANLRHPIAVYTKSAQACEDESDFSYSFAWRRRAFDIQVVCQDGKLRSVEVRSTEFMDAGPAVILAQADASGGLAVITEDSWATAFVGPPLRVEVRQLGEAGGDE